MWCMHVGPGGWRCREAAAESGGWGDGQRRVLRTVCCVLWGGVGPGRRSGAGGVLGLRLLRSREVALSDGSEPSDACGVAGSGGAQCRLAATGDRAARPGAVL